MSHSIAVHRYGSILKWCSNRRSNSAGQCHATATAMLSCHNHHRSMVTVSAAGRRLLSCQPQRVIHPSVFRSMPQPPPQPQRAISTVWYSTTTYPSIWNDHHHHFHTHHYHQKISSGGSTHRCFTTLPPHEVVGLPSLSPTMESGSISAWNVKAGDTVVAGDVFASIETDKAVVDFESQDDGIVAQILVPAGTEVKVNSPVMILVSDPKDVKAFENYTLADSAPTTVAAPTTEPAAPVAAAVPPPPPSSVATPTAAAPSGNGTVFASPLARKLAQDMGYDIAAIRGTGPSGRIIAADVKEYQPAAVVIPVPAVSTTTEPVAATATTSAPVPMSAPVVGSGYVDYPIPTSVTEVAARLAQSKRNVPHYYLTVDINADALIQLRQTVNTQLSAGSKKDANVATIGIYEYLIKAAGLSMRTIPSANAAWMETHVRVYDSVDVNIVVGAGESLNIRTIRNVTGIGVKSIMTALTNDDDAAADNGLGTFTMMNVGMYGVKSCAPIIREPQACAVAIGALQHRIIPNSSEADVGFQQSVMFTVTASFDHRVVDGAVGAQWLAAFKSYIENPSTLLL